ncbi:Hypothetical protein NTJ_13458 [Nesidiocoris tenuis]|uniref:Uncharacterized protein n=1 Tax=Nesidiocoris tenuis TaxID=355587 RepID=A0ABN7B8E1_9HEMI|nr:Hypothetical protein NTJ_13458 [Nesidiocoris tenuis]
MGEPLPGRLLLLRGMTRAVFHRSGGSKLDCSLGLIESLPGKSLPVRLSSGPGTGKARGCIMYGTTCFPDTGKTDRLLHRPASPPRLLLRKRSPGTAKAQRCGINYLH